MDDILGMTKVNLFILIIEPGKPSHDLNTLVRTRYVNICEMLQALMIMLSILHDFVQRSQTVHFS